MQKILHVVPDCRCYVSFEIFLYFVFWILLQLVRDIAVDGLVTAQRNEIVTIYADFQSSLFTVKCRAPGIFRIRCLSPAAVLPDHSQVFKLESRCLCVGDVRLTALVDEDSSGGRDSRRPAKV